MRRPARSIVDMLFVVRRMQELGSERKIPSYMCFIGDSPAPLWKVLARFGVPAKMLAVIRQFHDGMRACVRTDDGEHSESFGVTRRLR